MPELYSEMQSSYFPQIVSNKTNNKTRAYNICIENAINKYEKCISNISTFDKLCRSDKYIREDCAKKRNSMFGILLSSKTL